MKITTRCHSVRSRFSPLLRSRQRSEVATARCTIFVPSWVVRTSGSRPRLPTRVTLFTLPAMVAAPSLWLARQSSTRRGARCERGLSAGVSAGGCSTRLRAKARNGATARAAAARPRSDPRCRSRPRRAARGLPTGVVAQSAGDGAELPSLRHRRKGLDHAPVIGAGRAFERQQRRPRGMEHRIVGAVNDALEALVRRFAASSANRSALLSASRACSSTGRSIIGASSGPWMINPWSRMLHASSSRASHFEPAKTSVCTSASKARQTSWPISLICRLSSSVGCVRRETPRNPSRSRHAPRRAPASRTGRCARPARQRRQHPLAKARGQVRRADACAARGGRERRKSAIVGLFAPSHTIARALHGLASRVGSCERQRANGG